MNPLDEIRAVFLADDVDEDTRADNLRQIEDWQKTLTESEAFQSWQEHDITKRIIAKAKETYREVSFHLAMARTLSEEARASLFAKQDAARWIIQLGDGDPKTAIEEVHKQIRTAINNI